eukprot:m.210767 g.210767  ORF g.210767 m.210767 type:complete len:354 (+) comp15488_c0_seq6:400-1461(+)
MNLCLSRTAYFVLASALSVLLASVVRDLFWDVDRERMPGPCLPAQLTHCGGRAVPTAPNSMVMNVSTSSAPSPEFKPQQNQSTAEMALLVRGHTLSRAMLDRILAWALQGSSATPSVDVLLSVDTTTQTLARDVALKHFRARNTGVQISIHTYNNADMNRNFPELHKAMNRSHWKSAKSSAYGFHTEALLLWYWSLAPAQRQQYRYIWVFEADVAFSGPHIMPMLANYPDADLVTLHCHAIPQGWVHLSAVSDKYNESVPIARRLLSFEAVQRFSQQFLEILTTRLKSGQHAWSEQAACSFAAIEGLKILQLKKEDVGMPFSYGSRQKMTAFNFNRYSRHSFRQNKLYHPVKF